MLEPRPHIAGKRYRPAPWVPPTDQVIWGVFARLDVFPSETTCKKKTKHKKIKAEIDREAIARAVRSTLAYVQPLIESPKISEAVEELKRLRDAAGTLLEVLGETNPVTLRLLLSECSQSPSLRAALVMEMDLGRMPLSLMLNEIKNSGELLVSKLHGSSGGGPGTLLTHELGHVNYHLALQSRVILAACGCKAEGKTSSKVCRLLAALISLCKGSPDDPPEPESLLDYARRSYDFVLSHPEDFKEAYLNVLKAPHLPNWDCPPEMVMSAALTALSPLDYQELWEGVKMSPEAEDLYAMRRKERWGNR